MSLHEQRLCFRPRFRCMPMPTYDSTPLIGQLKACECHLCHLVFQQGKGTHKKEYFYVGLRISIQIYAMIPRWNIHS